MITSLPPAEYKLQRFQATEYGGNGMWQTIETHAVDEYALLSQRQHERTNTSKERPVHFRVIRATYSLITDNRQRHVPKQ